MRDLGHDQKFATAYQNFKTLVEEYAESDGRGEGLDGFYDGLDGTSWYWDENLMFGSGKKGWYQG